MRVRMKVQISGTRDGQLWPERGQTIDLPDSEAALLIATGIAEHDQEPDAEPAVEEATAPGAETSTPAKRRTTAKP
ncbi:hypothetical protein GCM10010387_22400 [Streptomyces inusitatus]|uniref:Uncharacterized protein n=1 Tax=Streptomyces inusitatus TaxID=68221 RepID=A0A918Q0I4_9ACTN|nr:hypothetical protein [Streptomyces inusitatus]GGZ28455.1 hypothetical protein GCM10010387_22400 [Streptomyces inusitatus]